MVKKKLDDVQLMFDSFEGNIYIGQVQKKLGDGLIFSDNKKEITQDFLNMMMRYCSETCAGKILEWDSGIGTVRFTPREDLDEK